METTETFPTQHTIGSVNCGIQLQKSGSSSFTALLELPPTEAMELLQNSTTEEATPAPLYNANDSNSAANCSNSRYVHSPAFGSASVTAPAPIFPSNMELVERASKFSVFASSSDNSQETKSSSECATKLHVVKEENTEGLDLDPSVDPLGMTDCNQKNTKRKEREKKAKEPSKKSKKAANEVLEDGGEKLPYVHVRARRGQATDSHSLAERARREKINARMKLLQELVPGCNKISGTAMVLDEIINHVQSLQRQVEFLSMRLAAVNPRVDFNLDSYLAAEGGSPMESNFHSMVVPSFWPEGQMNGNRVQHQQLWHLNGFHQPVWGMEEDKSNLITPENSLLSYDSPANSVGTASLHSSQLKMEL